jgi:hypothetical protein
MIHHANKVRPNLDGMKRWTSGQLARWFMTAPILPGLTTRSRAVKPHASPVLHHSVLLAICHSHADHAARFGVCRPTRVGRKIRWCNDFYRSVGLGGGDDLGALTQRYLRDHFALVHRRLYCAGGDAEIDEGTARSPEASAYGLSDLWWIVDINQSLTIAPEAGADCTYAEAKGWRYLLTQRKAPFSASARSPVARGFAPQC